MDHISVLHMGCLFFGVNKFSGIWGCFEQLRPHLENPAESLNHLITAYGEKKRAIYSIYLNAAPDRESREKSEMALADYMRCVSDMLIRLLGEYASRVRANESLDIPVLVTKGDLSDIVAEAYHDSGPPPIPPEVSASSIDFEYLY